MTQENGENNRDIQLPGYSLVSQIGSGGYGEVWLANAPGGLTKAVKFIYGYHNEKRAARELRSLEKIKEVRHPFLLSLERIEVIEGRLVIVTELADACLKDRFDACTEDGLPGIPRNELLKYLRDTADALDYLSDEHSLQHLDVKPENLLLLAGHIKVADFGLVKEIQDTQASLVGGMTPLYSAPEVFQGQPSSSSDQYSLAVLYQEMLVGKLPFAGVTSAELTLQHMHDEPDLSSLPLSDRYVLARALSKKPEQRYSSCSEMINALLSAESVDVNDPSDDSSDIGHPSAIRPQKLAQAQATHRPKSVTEVHGEDYPGDEARVSKSMLLEVPPSAETDSTYLSPVELSHQDFQPTPSLVIGIGGTASRVLRKLRHRVRKRTRQGEELPALQMLLLDTDPKSLIEATRDDTMTGLLSEETLTLALRRPQEYREHSTRLLRWLSRRWLYNIPKSLRTEGLRPLGRLAFADHARRTLQRIRLSLSQAIDEAAIAESNERTGMQFQEQSVRVFVVASVSGGTGSGMSLDVSYAARSVLEKMGISNATTIGVFLHSTGRDSRYCDLAKVNAYSWLTEFNHFSHPDRQYPGDPACGLPEQDKGVPALDHSYLVHLGDGLTEEQWDECSEQVADYLYLDALTPAQAFFEASRKKSGSSSKTTSLRTFGLHKVSAAAESELETVSAELCHRVVLSWTGADSGQVHAETASLISSEVDTASLSDTNQLVCGTAQAVAQLQINLEGIAANSRSIVEKQFGSHVEGLLEKLLHQASAEGRAATPHEIMRVVDGLFAAPERSESSLNAYVLQRPLEAIVSPLGMKLVADLQKWILHRLDDRQERLLGTQSAADWFSKHFEHVEADARRMVAGLRQQISESSVNENNQNNLQNAHQTGESSTLETAVRYFRLQLDLRALQATVHLTRMLQSELSSIRETVIEFGRHLRHLADSLAEPIDSSNELITNFTYHDASYERSQFAKLLWAEISEHVASIDRRVQEEFIDRQGGLF